MVGTIYLIKLKDEKVIPGVILKPLGNEHYKVSQLKPPRSEKIKKNVIDIGKPTGLKYHSVAIAYKVLKIHKSQLIKQISQIEAHVANDILEMNCRYIEKQSLHEELRSVKQKIALAQFNNESYKALDRRKSEILAKLGYNSSSGNRGNRHFAGFRVAPTKGRIKIVK